MRSARIDTWTGRGLRFGLGAATIGVGVLAGIARNKWLAHHLATSGIGVVGQIAALHTWLGIGAALGLGTAVARMVGAARSAGDVDRVRRITWTALSVTALATALLVVLGLLFAGPLAGFVLGDPAQASLVRISMLGLASYALNSVVAGLFAGYSDVRAPLTLAIVGGVTSVGITLGLVPRAGYAGAVLAVSLMLLVGTLGALVVHRRTYAGAFLPLPRPLLDRSMLSQLLALGAATLTIALVHRGVLLVTRAHFVQTQGIGAGGLFQAALALSEQIGGVFYFYLASYAFGRLSGFEGAGAMRAYTRRQWPPLMLLAAAAFGFAMLLAGPLLRLLYTDRFDPARPMAAWMLLGEFARVALEAWAVGLLPLAGPRRWVPLMLVFPLALGVCYAALTAAGAGALALALAYLGAGLAGLIVAGVVMSTSGVALRRRDVALLLALLSGLALLAWAVAR